MADILLKASSDDTTKQFLRLSDHITFYGSVISHSYYAIFYAANALLVSRGITVTAPEVHKKTYEAFKQTFIDTGVLDTRLLIIYKELVFRADRLLHILKEEKRKRGHFTYSLLSQANEAPALESFEHGNFFLKTIEAVL